MLFRRDYDYADQTFDGPYAREFPPETRRIGFAVPSHVLSSYNEATRCEAAGTWTAAAVMVGRALEAVCRDFDPEARGIHDGLRRMFNAGAISQELRDWGDGLRLVRNEGAHPGERVVPGDAKFSLDFLQALLEILYDLRPRFEAWQEDRARRAAARAARGGVPSSASEGKARSD
jgi:hypothetical protein